MRLRTTLGVGLLAMIVGLSAALRVVHLAGRGFIYWDEGKFALEGVRFAGAFHSLSGPAVALDAGKAVGTAKPTHALLIGLFDWAAGVHDYSALFLNASASVVSVILLYLLARRVFDPTVGLLSALFLAISEYDVTYARSGLSESDAIALFLGGVLGWSMGWGWRDRVVPGLLVGAAFTTNYRMIVYASVLIGVDSILEIRRAGRLEAFKGVAQWAAGMSVAPLIWQGVDLFERSQGVTLFRNELTQKPTLYLAQVLYQLHEGRQSRLQFNPLPYLHWYLVREGWGVVLLTVIGLGVTCWWIFGTRAAPQGSETAGRGELEQQMGEERSFPGAGVVLLGAIVVVPYVLYVFAPFTVPRNLAASIPFASILAAVGLRELVRKCVPRNFRTIALMGAAIALGIGGSLMSWRLTGEQSGYARASRYVDTSGKGQILVNNVILMFYLGGKGANCASPHIASHQELPKEARRDYHFVVVDQLPARLTGSLGRKMKLMARYSIAGRSPLGEDPVASETGASRLPDPYVSTYVSRGGSPSTGSTQRCTRSWF